MARPTDFREEFIEQAYKHSLLGATDEELAEIFGIVTSTLYQWKIRFPEFSEAIRAGKRSADSEVVYQSYRSAIGYYQEEVDVRAISGEVVQTTVKRFYPPDPRAQQFWLKNRVPDRWRDRAEPTKVELELTFKRDPERFARVIEQVEDEPDRAKALALMAGHPADVQEHLRLVLQGVPEDQIEAVYNSAIGTILAASGRGQGEQPAQSLLERQKLDVTEMGSGYMANLDEETEEEKAKLQDAVEKVEKHNAKVRSRSKKPR